MPAAERFFLKPTDRTIIAASGLLIFSFGLYSRIGFSFVKFGPAGWLADNLGLNIGEILAVAAFVKICADIGSRTILSRFDLVALMALLSAAVIPDSKVIWAIATVLGLGWAVGRRDEPSLSSLGQILIACAVHELWGPLIFNFIVNYFVNFETAVAAKLLTTFSTGYSSQFNQIAAANGHTIEIGTGCSAFHNLSLGALIWISIIKLHRNYYTALDFIALAGTFAAVITINEIRIMLMARSLASLTYWHDGAGVTIMSAALLASVGALLFLTTRFNAPSLRRS